MSKQSPARRGFLEVGRSTLLNLRHVTVVSLLLLLATVAGKPIKANIGKRAEEHPPLPELDVFCGPRCVDFVLQYYGKTEIFSDLVREIQWPDVERGCSMDAMKTSLERRHVHTLALRRLPGTILNWNRPVIVHLHRNGDPTLGHYVVWLPSSTARTIRIWNGIHGLQEVPIDEFLSEMSGVVLLTSLTPVEDCSAAFIRSTGFDRFVSGPFLDCFTVLFPSIGILGLYFLYATGEKRWGISANESLPTTFPN